MITLEGLTKRYGATRAVDALDLTVCPGRVTGFHGPNGAGKSTTMRMILGLDTPTEGTALVDGRPYAAWPAPLTKVGALLDAKALHPRRSARNHLIAMARSNGIPISRVDEVPGDLAHELGVRLHELHTERASLEEAYMELTADSVQYGVAVAS
ncbi:ATP-binding cassette domain-containing protein [Kribbella sp. CWNU-51]